MVPNNTMLSSPSPSHAKPTPSWEDCSSIPADLAKDRRKWWQHGPLGSRCLKTKSQPGSFFSGNLGGRGQSPEQWELRKVLSDLGSVQTVPGPIFLSSDPGPQPAIGKVFLTDSPTLFSLSDWSNKGETDSLEQITLSGEDGSGLLLSRSWLLFAC